MCLGEAALHSEDLATLAGGNAVMQFMAKATSALVAYNERSGHGTMADLPDAVAMGCALWPEMVRETVPVYAYCCTKEEPSYGQVIFFDRTVPMSVETQIPADNAVVVKAIDPLMFRRQFLETLERLGE